MDNHNNPVRKRQDTMVVNRILEFNKLKMIKASLVHPPHPARQLLGAMRRALNLLADYNVAAARTVLSDTLRNAEETNENKPD